MARTLVGWTDAHYALDQKTNLALPNAAIDVQVLETGEAVTDLQTPPGYIGQPFPVGQARADESGFYGFTVPDGTGPVRVRVAATATEAPGQWLTPAGQALENGPLLGRREAATLYAPVTDTRPTKVAGYSFGGAGGGSGTNSLDDYNFRYPFRLPVATKRWRLHIRNIEYRNDAAPFTGTINFTGFWIGQAAKDPVTGEFALGNFTAPPAQALGPVSAVDGAELVTDWVEDPALQPTPYVDHLLSFGYTKNPSNHAIARGVGASFFAAGHSADAGAQTSAATIQGGVTVADIWMEYEFEGQNPVLLIIGDSITEGNAAERWTRDSWSEQLSMRTGALAMRNSYSGATTERYNDPSFALWDRMRGVPVDGVIMFLGTNDLGGSTPVATIQANYQAIIGELRTQYGQDVPIYMATIPPRSLAAGSAQETDRQTLNAWLRGLPFGIHGIFDFDLILRDPANPLQLEATYRPADNIHVKTPGQARMAQEIGSRLVLPVLT